jgi:putative ABC transport system permease protein
LGRHFRVFFGEMKVKGHRPSVPSLANQILGYLYSRDYYLERAGDLEEAYADLYEDSGPFRTRVWLFFQILKLCFGAIRASISWRLIMLKNYFKITLRIVKQHKEYSFINIAGLALGIACCLLILFWVQDELSFDRFHENADHLYRIIEDLDFEGRTLHIARTPSAAAPALLEEIPEVVNSALYLPAPSLLMTHGENNFYENGVAFASPSFLEMFTFPLIKGDKRTVLGDVSSIVITADAAEKYFDREDPIDKTLRINNKYDFIVKGVIENVPRNSHLKFDFLLPFLALENMPEDAGIRWRPVMENWGVNFYFSYIQVVEHTDIHALDSKIVNFIEEHSSITSTKLHVQPIKKIHLHSNLVADVEDNGSIKHVYIFSIIAFFVLLIACINFMNLTTACASRRAKEVGMRKISGARRGQIINQFLGESIFLSFFSLVFAVCIVLLFLPIFNNLSGKELSLDMTNSEGLFLVLIALTVATGILAGSYPAFFLSSFQPVNILRSSGKSGLRKMVFRRFLVVIQFSLSIFLIIATFVIHNQLHFIQNSSLGFERDHVVYIRLRGETAQYFKSVKNELLKNPNILGVTAANQLPTHIMYSITGAYWEGKDPKDDILFHFITVDYDFIQTLNLQLSEGRAFSKEFQSDQSAAFILNEKAAAYIGKESVVGEAFGFYGRRGRIIGVVKNFHFDNFYNEIKPLVLLYEAPSSDNFLIAKISGDDMAENLALIEESWNKTVPFYPFEYNFLDEDFNRQYQSEKRMVSLFNSFTFLSVFIASLGLFGLVSFIANQRTKEIGIRRVVGASVSDIVKILTKEFVLLVAVANFIAWPAAYYFMSQWLDNFVFRTHTQLWMFLFSASIAFVIAFLSVSYKTIKAAKANPVDSLRYE